MLNMKVKLTYQRFKTQQNLTNNKNECAYFLRRN
jgi:hypothetical protein